MDKKEFIHKWLPTDGALQEEFKNDLESLVLLDKDELKSLLENFKNPICKKCPIIRSFLV